MKQLLLNIIMMRRRLIKEKKSFIYQPFAEDFMSKLSYWISTGADCWKLCERWDNELRIIMPKTFIKKYELLLQEHKNEKVLIQ